MGLDGLVAQDAMTAFPASQTETDAVLGRNDDVVQLGLAGIAFAQIAAVVAGASLGAFAERISTRIEQLTPLAGMAIQSTTDRMLSPFDGRGGMPIGPWQGLGAAFAWALGILALGYVLLRARDA